MAEGDVKKFQLKRIGCGKACGFKIRPLYSGLCNDPMYYFRIKSMYQPIGAADYIDVEIEGGIGPFVWSFSGVHPHLDLVSANTTNRTNILCSNPSIVDQQTATISVTDSCGKVATAIATCCLYKEGVKGLYPTAGDYWVAGENGQGQLGMGDTSDRAWFTELGGSNWTKWGVSEGYGPNTFGFKSDNSMWGTGRNSFGELGLPNPGIYLDFTQVPGEWKCSAQGVYFSLAIKMDGTLWGAGRADGGALGMGDISATFWDFTQIGEDDDWMDVACGIDHSIAIKTSGQMYGTGNNTNGQLALGDNTRRYEFTTISFGHVWKSITCGKWCTLAIDEDGDLYVAGYNYIGLLGLGPGSNNYNTFNLITSEEEWSQISYGHYNTIGIKKDGTLWGSGNNGSGQLGLGHRDYVFYYTKIGIENDWKFVHMGMGDALALKGSGTLWRSGGYGGDIFAIIAPEHLWTSMRYSGSSAFAISYFGDGD